MKYLFYGSKRIPLPDGLTSDHVRLISNLIGSSSIRIVDVCYMIESLAMGGLVIVEVEYLGTNKGSGLHQVRLLDDQTLLNVKYLFETWEKAYFKIVELTK